MDGVVASFDDHRGYGTIAAGAAAYFFHCTNLADGTRTVEVGTPVTFTVVPGHGGRWEATAISVHTAS